MRYQETTYSCGAAAVLNAARCFGKRISERIIRSIAETTLDGTDEHGIVRALDIIGLHGESFEEAAEGSTTMARVRLETDQRWSGNVIIICTQNLQHWVTVIGTTDLGGRFIVIDSARTKRNMKENGVQILSEKELRKTWQTRSGKFFGIVVRRKTKRRNTSKTK